MNLSSQTLQTLLKYNITLNASLDEQQLIDSDLIKRFVDYCKIKKDETVLEIGLGIGNITKHLLEKECKVICIEKNPKFIPVLEERFKDNKNLKIIQGNALKIDLPQHDRHISNLPYMICEAFFQRTLRLQFLSAVYIVPLNFSETLTAKFNDEKYTKLTWIADLFYSISIIEKIPPSSYLPKPKIITSIISIKPKYNSDKSEILLKTMLKQGDKYTKNALREALIRASICNTKNHARRTIDQFLLSPKILDKRVSRLSLEELRFLKKIITKVLSS